MIVPTRLRGGGWSQVISQKNQFISRSEILRLRGAACDIRRYIPIAQIGHRHAQDRHASCESESQSAMPHRACPTRDTAHADTARGPAASPALLNPQMLSKPHERRTGPLLERAHLQLRSAITSSAHPPSPRRRAQTVKYHPDSAHTIHSLDTLYIIGRSLFHHLFRAHLAHRIAPL
jgi:hypothetical protein